MARGQRSAKAGLDAARLLLHARKDVLWRDKSISRGLVVLCKREIIGLVRAFISVGRNRISLLVSLDKKIVISSVLLSHCGLSYKTQAFTRSI